MKKKLLLISLCSFLLVCTGCKKEVELKDGKQVIASVKGKKITAEDLFDDLKDKYGAAAITEMIDTYIVSKEVKDSKEAKEFADAQAKSMRQQYEAAGYDFDGALKDAGITEDDLKKDYANQYNKDVVVKNYLKANVTDKETNEYYEKEIYGSYTVKHILIKPEVNDDMSSEEKEKAKEEALKTAKKVIKKLNDGEKWADLVKKYSDDEGSVKEEGLIENFTKGDVVDEFFEASLELKDGKYTKEPVESTYGYHIILKVSNTKKPSLKSVKDKVLDKIVENKLNNDETLYDNTWVEIRKAYNIKINDSKVKSDYNKSISK